MIVCEPGERPVKVVVKIGLDPVAERTPSNTNLISKKGPKDAVGVALDDEVKTDRLWMESVTLPAAGQTDGTGVTKSPKALGVAMPMLPISNTVHINIVDILEFVNNYFSVVLIISYVVVNLD